MFCVTLWVEVRTERPLNWSSVLHLRETEPPAICSDACEGAIVEFAFSEEPNSLKRQPVVIFVCVVNDCRSVGESSAESAELQCDLDLIHLLDWCISVVFSVKRMNNFPLEIFLAVKGVD
jgi:hypothetical protein